MLNLAPQSCAYAPECYSAGLLSQFLGYNLVDKRRISFAFGCLHHLSYKETHQLLLSLFEPLHFVWMFLKYLVNSLFNLPLIRDLNQSIFFNNGCSIFACSKDFFKNTFGCFPADCTLLDKLQHLNKLTWFHRTFLKRHALVVEKTQQLSHHPVAYRFWL